MSFWRVKTKSLDLLVAKKDIRIVEWQARDETPGLYGIRFYYEDEDEIFCPSRDKPEMDELRAIYMQIVKDFDEVTYKVVSEKHK